MAEPRAQGSEIKVMTVGSEEQQLVAVQRGLGEALSAVDGAAQVILKQGGTAVYDGAAV